MQIPVADSMHAQHVLCEINDLNDPGAREFRFGTGDWPLRILVVREGDEIRAYLNRCPHLGYQLNGYPDQFFAPDGKLLLCLWHGAVFEKLTGLCVGGPCTGASLIPIAINVAIGEIRLVEPLEVLIRRFG